MNSGRLLFWLVLFLLLAAPGVLSGQVRILGEDKVAARRLQEADRAIALHVQPDAVAGWLGRAAQPSFSLATSLIQFYPAQEKWAEALEEYQRLLQDLGDVLISIPAKEEGFERFLQLRLACQQRMAGLPPSLVQQYRRQVDAQTHDRWKKARPDRDAGLLRKIVDESFAATATDQVLEYLGDLAFEKGHFEEALQWWRKLFPPASEADLPLTGMVRYPHPQLEPARIRARQILAYQFLGDAARVENELRAFAILHPKAEGILAGKKGPYLQLLKELLKNVHVDEAPGATFAAGPSRQGVSLVGPTIRLGAGGPAWRIPLARQNKNAVAAVERPVFFPVLTADNMLLGDGQSVWAHDLRTGKVKFQYDLFPAKKEQEPRLPTPAHATSRYTLTLADTFLFARLGAQAIGPKAEESYVVCLDLKMGRARWKIAAHQVWDEGVFEGTPLYHDGKLFLALTRVQGKRTQIALACLAADSGAVRWLQEVAEINGPDAAAPRFRHHLVTLAGSQVVYCTHAGVVVALDGYTGKRTWAVRYPRKGSTPLVRDLAPCLYHDGRVVAAPEDCSQIFCLDAATGQVLWERDDLEVIHLLGVAAGRLIVTTTSGMRALELTTGLDRGGWRQPGQGKLLSAGRGLLAGGWVFWPTQDQNFPLRALCQRLGTLERFGPEGPQAYDPTQLRTLPPGNLVFGHGCLVIAGRDQLVVFPSQK